MKSSNSKEKAIPAESGTALERAKSFQSQNRFFVREMFPSYIQRNIMVPFSHKQTNQMHSNTHSDMFCYITDLYNALVLLEISHILEINMHRFYEVELDLKSSY